VISLLLAMLAVSSLSVVIRYELRARSRRRELDAQLQASRWVGKRGGDR
jgi:Tfp pilus assembly protein FimT